MFEVNTVPEDDGAVEREAGRRTIPGDELANGVVGEVIARRKQDALLLISSYARHYGRIVELENNDALITLDTRELTIRVINERGESAWLHQVGSLRAWTCRAPAR